MSTVVVLAGCAPAVVPTSSPSPTAVASAPTDTPTPTPTAASAEPTIRVPLQCGSLFTSTAATALVGVPVTASVDESTKPADVSDVADVQRGILTCTWGGKDKTDSGYDQALSIYVEPDGAEDFATNLAYLKKGFADAQTNTFGDESTYGCGSGDGFDCAANVLVGSYWLTVDLHDFDSLHQASKLTVESRIKQVLTIVVPALQSAGEASAPWIAPVGAISSYCTKKNNVVDARKAFGSPGLSYDSDPPQPFGDVSTIAESGADYASCAWYQLGDTPKGQSSDASVGILHGGGWAIPQFVADPPTQWYVGTYKVVSVPGTTGAVLACNNADCDAIVGIGTDAVEIAFSNLGTVRNLNGLTAMVAAIAAD